MTILYRKHYRLTDLSDKNSAKKAFPTITYEYGQAATLTEVAKEISGNSGVSEGETISVLKDFRTLLRKLLLSGRSVNIDGLGFFYLSAKSKGTEKAEDFTANDITGLRICFRANSDIRLVATGATRSDGLSFKDVDRIQNGSADGGNGGNGGFSDGGEEENPLG